jgi:hypothetical protein
MAEFSRFSKWFKRYGKPSVQKYTQEQQANEATAWALSNTSIIAKDSSYIGTFHFTPAIENPTTNKGILSVTFVGGGSWRYHSTLQQAVDMYNASSRGGYVRRVFYRKGLDA